MKKLLIVLILSGSLLQAGDRSDLQKLEQTIHKIARRSAFNRYIVVPFALYGGYTAAKNTYENKEAITKHAQELNHKLQTGQEPQESLKKIRTTLTNTYREIFRKLDENRVGAVKKEEKATLQDVQAKAAETVETLKAVIRDPENTAAIKAQIESTTTEVSDALRHKVEELKAAIVGEQDKADDKKDDASK